jgi:hypothetical protein
MILYFWQSVIMLACIVKNSLKILTQLHSDVHNIEGLQNVNIK